MADTNVQILADRKDIVAVADAVRAKTGATAALTLGGMVTAIEDINVGSDPVLQDKTVTPTTSKQTITADSGYDGLDTVTVNAMPTVTQATPSISVNSSGLITASATQTAGYVAAGTKSATKQLTTQAAKTITPSTSSQTAVASGRYTTGAVTVAAIPSTYVKPTATKAAATYTPSTSNQTIAAGTYLSGAQTIKGDANLTAANIAEGVSIFGVTGTHSGVEDLNAELTTQESLIAELSGILDTKAGGGEQATPVISVNSTNGLITATAGTKTSTHQLAFQAAKTITPGTTNQTAVSSGYYTGGAVTVKGDSNLVAGNIKSGVSIFGVNGNYAGSGGGDTSVEDGLVARTFTSYTNDRVTTIGSCAFYGCYSLTTISFPAATTIGASAFGYCYSLTTVSFPAVTNISSYAFNNCSKLATVSFPAATTMGNNAFYGCYSLTTISFPAATTIGADAFNNCSKLATVSFPAATTIGDDAFNKCSKLTTVSFPVAQTIGSSAFYGCYSLTTISFPVAQTIGTDAFRYCSKLGTVSFPVVMTIYASAFRNCYNLKSLYLTGSSLCKLSASNAFSSTPIGGYSKSAGTYGSIYVPASLLASYKATTNWTYFSSRFVGI